MTVLEAVYLTSVIIVGAICALWYKDIREEIPSTLRLIIVLSLVIFCPLVNTMTVAACIFMAWEESRDG